MHVLQEHGVSSFDDNNSPQVVKRSTIGRENPISTRSIE
jgi:hypothetical protein